MNLNYDPKPKYFNMNYQPNVGHNVSLVNTLLDCNNQINIEDNVAFGHNCMVLTGYHNMALTGEERMLSTPSKPITIRRGAWIASGSIILPGVTVGENAVVGAGSVVTHDVPDNEFWAGNPCRFIRIIK